MNINICKEFTATPGARFKKDGPFSGEEFFDTLLAPKYEEAVRKREKLVINLDGDYGYSACFLDYVFGMLSCVHEAKEVLHTVRFISNDDPSLVDDIKEYILKALGEYAPKTRKIHELKTWSEYFNAVCSKEKTFEYRFNDRDYKVHDILYLREFTPIKAIYSVYSIMADVNYIFDTGDRYVIMSIDIGDNRKEKEVES